MTAPTHDVRCATWTTNDATACTCRDPWAEMPAGPVTGCPPSEPIDPVGLAFVAAYTGACDRGCPAGLSIGDVAIRAVGGGYMHSGSCPRTGAGEETEWATPTPRPGR